MKSEKVIFEARKQGASSLNGYFRDCIEYKHLDGTQCKYNCATYKENINEWFDIHTEHNGAIMLHKGDVYWIKENGKTLYVNADENKVWEGA